MHKRAKIINGLFQQEAGQALVLMLIFLLLGSLTLAPVLAHMATALKTETKYEVKTNELFTADAGIETGLWRIKYDFMGPDYDPYDFETVWLYETDPVNGLSADVTVQNVWFPRNLTLDSLGLDAAEARAIIESEKLVISGTSGAVPGQPFYIKMDFNPDDGDNLTIKSIGAWLPQGFTYDTGSCSLFDDPFAAYYPDSVEVATVPGGQTVAWSYDAPYPLFTSFPNYEVIEDTLSVSFSFTYEPPASDPEKMPLAVAWVTTDMDPTCINPNDVPIVWDTDMRYYRVTSSTGETNIETYSSKSQLRNLGNGIAGDYVAIGNSVMLDNYYPYDKRDTLLTSSSTDVADVSPIPADGDVLYAYLYWSGFRHSASIFADTCANFNNWERSSEDGSQTRVPIADGDISGVWNTSPCWDDVDETSPNDTDYMTGTTDSGGYQLFAFTPFAVPDQPITGLTVYFRAKDVGSGSGDIRASIKVNGNYYQGNTNSTGNSFTTYPCVFSTNPATGLAWTAADINGTGANSLQQFGVYSTDLNPDVQVSMVYAQVNYESDSRWTIYSSSQFQGQGTSDTGNAPRTIELADSFNLSSYPSGTIAVGWNQYEYGYLEYDDTLYYAVSGDGGATWSGNIEAFHDDNPSSTHYYVVPDAYKTSSFKIRFYFDFDLTDEYVRLDNINIYSMPPDTSVTFEIEGEQVYLDANGDPQSGSQPLTASHSAVLVNPTGTNSPGYSYACYKDVSKLVKKYPEAPGEEHHTGNYEFTVGDIYADTGEYVSYAGWSLIIIYGSPTTAGRYIYLRDIQDIFAFNPGNTNLDFDNDGEGGGDITGFLFPEPIRDKSGDIRDPRAAKITCFVGEGDVNYDNDTLVITGQQSLRSLSLSNTSSPVDNVWNSSSPGMSYPGIDVDTFDVLWNDEILTPKDTKLHLDMDSGTDAWNLIYVIVSVRSETVTSGTGHYVIGSN